MYDFDTCNPGLGFLNSHEHQKNQKINKCALENPCETIARREQVWVHTAKNRALDNELIACNKLTSSYFVNPSCSLCIRIAGHTPQSQKRHS